MLINFRNIHSRDEFFQIRPFNIQEFSHEFFQSDDHLLHYVDYLSKINDVIFPLNELLALRILTNSDAPYLINTDSAFLVIEGACRLETICYEEQATKRDWVKAVTTQTKETRDLGPGDSIELHPGENHYYLLRPEGKCVLAHWNFQEKSPTNFLGKFKFDFFQLSDQGRKLIKLSKNIYANDSKKAPDILKAEFHRVLDRISEQDLFFIHLTKAYLVVKAQSADFHRYYEERLGIQA